MDKAQTQPSAAEALRAVADKLTVTANNPASHGGERGLREHMKAAAKALHALAASQEAPKAGDAVRRAVMSADLYAVLTDVQNGIDSPGLASMANSAIRLIDKARDEYLAAPTPPASQGDAAPGGAAESPWKMPAPGEDSLQKLADDLYDLDGWARTRGFSRVSPHTFGQLHERVVALAAAPAPAVRDDVCADCGGITDPDYGHLSPCNPREPAADGNGGAVDDTVRLGALLRDGLTVKRMADTGLFMLVNGDGSPVTGEEFDDDRAPIDAWIAARTKEST